MWHKLKKTGIFFLTFLMVVSAMMIPSSQTENVQAAQTARIHYLTLPENTVAILLECNGMFGMVDSGEDSDYPDGTDDRYPLRSGITTAAGYEQDVISYMKSVGVTQDNFEFYIGTHPHSDHIGSADEIIRAFHPKRVYIQEYKDSYISNTSNLWDNLYVYDNMIEAALETGASVILGFDPEASVYPEQVSVQGSILWNDSENADQLRPTALTVVLTDNTTGISYSQEISQADSDIWNYSFLSVPKYDASKTEISYSVSIETPNGYLVTHSDSYDFICSHLSISDILPLADISFDTQSGIEDTFSLETSPESSSDDMTSDNISSSDSVDATDPLDPNNTTSNTSEEGKIGAYDQLSSTQNTVASPEFTLGSEMKIKIMHYGGDYQINPKPDVNYFSLGVYVEANGKSAFISGDINNYEGAETALTQELGHVDILTLGHHGYYGSNTDSYVTGLTPEILVLPGTFSGVSNKTTSSGEMGTLDTLITMGNSGVPLYTTAWYHDQLDALVFNFDASISNNLPTEHSSIAVSKSTSPMICLYYCDGFPQIHSGWVTANGYTCLFENSMYSVSNRWIKNSDGTYLYLNSDGFVNTGWVNVDEKYFYMDESGIMQTGWLNYEDQLYYLHTDGSMATGKTIIDSKEYYFHTDGSCVVSDWVNGHYYGADGVWIPTTNSCWRQDSTGWWYENPDGTYLVSTWEYIDGDWYYFDETGYMVTGWIFSEDHWYYCSTSGARQSGWIRTGSYWYYMDPDSGQMQTGWITLKKDSYFLNENGAMITGWYILDENYYYFYSSGILAKKTWINDYYVDENGIWIKDMYPDKWICSGNRWWYRHPDGSYTKSDWEQINDKWYYFDADGWMCIGWKELNGKWYYLSSGGSRYENGWHKINGIYYYFYSNGVMAADTWIDTYYVDKSGAWTKSIYQAQKS